MYSNILVIYRTIVTTKFDELSWRLELIMEISRNKTNTKCDQTFIQYKKIHIKTWNFGTVVLCIMSRAMS